MSKFSDKGVITYPNVFIRGGKKWILLCIPDKSISTAGHNILKCVPTVLKTIPKLWGGKLVLSSAARV